MQEEWKLQLAEQVRKELDQYTPARIKLDTARVNEIVLVTARTLYVIDSSSKSALGTVKLNRIRAGDLALKKGTRIISVFTSLYLSNAAQPGEWLDCIFGRDFVMSNELERDGEVQPCFIVTNIAADVNTPAASHICNAALIRAHTTNAGLVWLDFGAAAVDGACYPLASCDAVAHSMSNTNKINALFKTANDKVTVTYKI